MVNSCGCEALSSTGRAEEEGGHITESITVGMLAQSVWTPHSSLRKVGSGDLGSLTNRPVALRKVCCTVGT